MKKIIYVTGCLGFIASHFTRTCLKMGWYVKGIDKITYAANLDFLEEFKKYSLKYFSTNAELLKNAGFKPE